MQLHRIPKDKLVISETRQRQACSPEALVELMESIGKVGLLHPIIVRPVEDHWVLVAGERRARALQGMWLLNKSVRCGSWTIDPNFYPALTLGELDPLDAEEAELDENTRRVDLTWQERAAATKRLVDLRYRIAESRGLPTPSRLDISTELQQKTGGDLTVRDQTTRQELIVAHLLADPEIQAASTLKDAYKIAKRKDQRQRNEELARELGQVHAVDHYKLYHGDCLTKLPEITGVDVILTDPPYGMSADTFGDANGIGNVRAHNYNDDPKAWWQLMHAFLPLTWSITKEQAHLYIFCDINQFYSLRVLAEEVGWEVFRTPFIWHKPHGSRAPWPLYGPQRKYELVLYAVKGKRPVNYVAGDVLTQGADPQLDHSAQKPVGLFQNLLSRSTAPGDLVLDPFCGTGTIFPAAAAVHCKAIGIELDAAYYATAAQRIRELA